MNGLEFGGPFYLQRALQIGVGKLVPVSSNSSDGHIDERLPIDRQGAKIFLFQPDVVLALASRLAVQSLRNRCAPLLVVQCGHVAEHLRK
jgi:hypothetical protein